MDSKKNKKLNIAETAVDTNSLQDNEEGSRLPLGRGDLGAAEWIDSVIG